MAQFRVDDQVVLHSLKTTKFNGLKAKIVTPKEDGRHGVYIEDMMKTIRVRPQNLKLIDEEHENISDSDLQTMMDNILQMRDFETSEDPAGMNPLASMFMNLMNLGGTGAGPSDTPYQDILAQSQGVPRHLRKAMPGYVPVDYELESLVDIVEPEMLNHFLRLCELFLEEKVWTTCGLEEFDSCFEAKATAETNFRFRFVCIVGNNDFRQCSPCLWLGSSPTSTRGRVLVNMDPTNPHSHHAFFGYLKFDDPDSNEDKKLQKYIKENGFNFNGWPPYFKVIMGLNHRAVTSYEVRNTIAVLETILECHHDMGVHHRHYPKKKGPITPFNHQPLFEYTSVVEVDDVEYEITINYPYTIYDLGNACRSCNGHCEPEIFEICEECGSRLGCSPDCTAIIALDEGHPCASMKLLRPYIDEAQKLQTFFELPKSPNFVACMQEMGLYGKGIWSRVLPKDCELLPFGSIEFDWAISEELIGTVGDLEGKGDSKHVASWEEYYELCDIPASSPIGEFMTFPLTLYHCLKSYCEPQGEFLIHMAGVEVEIEIASLFQELLFFYPDVNFTIHMYALEGYGRKALGDVDGRSVEYTHPNASGSLKILIHEQAYSTLIEEKPDFFIAFNAGIHVYEEWGSAVDKLVEQKIPTIFSDFLSVSMLNNMVYAKNRNLDCDFFHVVNPFAFMKYPGESDALSNAYLLGLNLGKPLKGVLSGSVKDFLAQFGDIEEFTLKYGLGFKSFIPDRNAKRSFPFKDSFEEEMQNILEANSKATEI